MKNFIVVEVGSSVSKAYQYIDEKIIALPSSTLMFKAHLKNGVLETKDVDDLCEFILELKQTTKNVYVYGTSVFRKLDKKEQTAFLKEFKQKTKCTFNIVSSEQEALYTVSGVTLGNNFTGRLAIMIGGGGSIEVMIVENKKVIEKHFNDFGAVTINEHFKNINEFHPRISMKKLDEFCQSHIEEVTNKCDILVTAGGDPKYCQECMASAYLSQNKFYEDNLQPHMIEVKDYMKANKDFIYKQNIDVFRSFTVYQNEWWDFARGYNLCIGAVAQKIGATYEIPTKINMCIGIINELKSK